MILKIHQHRYTAGFLYFLHQDWIQKLMNFPEILHHWPHCFLIGHKSRDDHGSSEKFRGSASKFSHIYCFVCGSCGELAVFALFASDQFDDWDPCTQFLFAQTQSMWSIFHLRVLMTFKTLEFLQKTFNRTLANGRWYQFLFSFSELKRFYFSHKFGGILFHPHSSVIQASKLQTFINSTEQQISKFYAAEKFCCKDGFWEKLIAVFKLNTKYWLKLHETWQGKCLEIWINIWDFSPMPFWIRIYLKPNLGKFRYIFLDIVWYIWSRIHA